MRRSIGVVLASLMLLIACQEVPTDQATVPSPALGNGNGGGKGGGNGGGGASDIALVGVFADASGDRITSDGRGPYVHDECGVAVEIPAQTNDGSALLDPDRSRIRRKDATICGSLDPRFIRLDYSGPVDGQPVSDPVLVETGGTASITQIESIPVGQIVLTQAKFNNERCSALQFQTLDDRGPTAAQSDFVEVHRIDADTWHVRTRPGEDVAWCRDEDRLYHMPFSLTLTRK